MLVPRYSTTGLMGALCMICLFLACDGDEPGGMTPQGQFDRGAMLIDWADEIIIPSLEAYVQSTNSLRDAAGAFTANSDMDALATLRSAWLSAYLLWQPVSMFDIGKAEEIGLRNFTNIYPTNVTEIEANVANEQVNLALPSNFDAQGFPALDYLLFGQGTAEETLAKLSGPHGDYLLKLVDRLHELASEVLQDWQAGYREVFVSGDGASATASTDKLVNDVLFYYEKFLRAGKIGIPAGVFSGSKIPTAVEGLYAQVHSKALFEAALNAVIDFYRGVGVTGRDGISLADYLTHNAEDASAQELNEDILEQFERAKEKGDLLMSNFSEQVETNNVAMLEAYDELQKVVILMKVDMMQALNIQIDYVDADGD
ncbi:MAG: imelysin family protein [Saprospiraceae bacterium]|nr:imelysin family protein [Saprospiraceae bacterium]